MSTISTRQSSEIRVWLMTWPEVEAAISAGSRTVVIVAGASEQHGPHLPEATDNLIGEELACRLARMLGNALVAPVIPFGCSDHHLGFGGSISVDADLLMQVLDAYIASLRRHGLERFVVFSSHGGNFPILAEWRRQQPADVIVISDLRRYAAAMLSAVRPFGRQDEAGPHADVTETAAMLVLHPHLVRMDLAEAGRVDTIAMDELLDADLRHVSGNGVLGDPRGATPEMGEAVLSSLSDHLLSTVRGDAR